MSPVSLPPMRGRSRGLAAGVAAAALTCGVVLLVATDRHESSSVPVPVATAGPLTAVHDVVTFTLAVPAARYAQDTLGRDGFGQVLEVSTPTAVDGDSARRISVLAVPAPDPKATQRAVRSLELSGGAANVVVTKSVLACGDFMVPEKAKGYTVGLLPWQVTPPPALASALTRVRSHGGWTLTAAPGGRWLLRACVDADQDQSEAVTTLTGLGDVVAKASSLPADTVPATPVGTLDEPAHCRCWSAARSFRVQRCRRVDVPAPRGEPAACRRGGHRRSSW